MYFAFTAVGEPDRVLWGLTNAFPPVGQGSLPQRNIARGKDEFPFRGVNIYFLH